MGCFLPEEAGDDDSCGVGFLHGIGTVLTYRLSLSLKA